MNKVCFVVSAIGAPSSPTRYHSDNVLEHLIKPVCSDLGFDVIRVDQESSTGNINDSIINHLKSDELVIADMTEHNPNAFYELGFRQALNLPLIPIIQKDQHLPFDVSNQRTLFYSLHIAEIESSKSQLRSMIESYQFKPTSTSDETTSPVNFSSIDQKLDKIIRLLSKKDSLSTLNLDSSTTNHLQRLEDNSSSIPNYFSNQKSDQ